MNIGLQKHIIGKILEKRGNPNKVSDIGAILYNLDNERNLSENLQMLEIDGYILPVPIDEMGDYLMKQNLILQKELDEEEQSEENDRIVKMMRRRYGIEIKRARPKPVKEK